MGIREQLETLKDLTVCIQMYDNLSVTVSLELKSELISELFVVVYLAIEHKEEVLVLLQLQRLHSVQRIYYGQSDKAKHTVLEL